MKIVMKTADKDMIVWKKARYTHPRSKRVAYCLIKLSLPKGTRYIGYDSCSPELNLRKNRAEKAVVLGIYRYNKSDYKYTWPQVPLKKIRKLKVLAYSEYHFTFGYTEGQTVRPTAGFSEKLRICESGIHFFWTREDAKNYDFS